MLFISIFLDFLFSLIWQYRIRSVNYFGPTRQMKACVIIMGNSVSVLFSDVFVEGLADCEPAYHRVWAKCKKRYPLWHLIVCLPLHAFTVCSLLRCKLT